MKTFKVGPHRAYHGRTFGGYYISLLDGQTKEQLGSDLIVSRKCDSLEELKAEVSRLKSELDEAFEEAKTLYAV